MSKRRGSIVDVYMQNVEVNEAGETHVPWYKKVVVEESLLGEKTIGSFGSIVLLINNVTGPGMLLLPVLFQQAGWLVPVGALVVVGGVSTLACCCLVEAVSRLPGNKGFERRAEFYNVFHFYFGDRVASFWCPFSLFCVTAHTFQLFSFVSHLGLGLGLGLGFVFFRFSFAPCTSH